MTWKQYIKTATQEMRPYIEGEDLSGVSASLTDTPGPGGMIARNPKNHDDQWYVAADFFQANYREYDPMTWDFDTLRSVKVQ